MDAQITDTAPDLFAIPNAQKRTTPPIDAVRKTQKPQNQVTDSRHFLLTDFLYHFIVCRQVMNVHSFAIGMVEAILNNNPVRNILYALAALLFLTPTSSYAQSPSPLLDMFSPDTVLVKFKPGTPATSQAEAHRAANSAVDRTLAGTDILLMRVPSGSVNRSLRAYQSNPNISYAEKNYRRVIYLPTTLEGSESLSTLTFYNFNEQWNLHNTGQEFGLTLNYNGSAHLYPNYEGVPNADINAPEAWEISHGDSSLSIAILDTGVACDHLDLNGKCVDSFNFVADKSSSPDDLIGHGTHVAGIAAASTDNGIGIAGVGWDSSIAALKVCWEDYVSMEGFVLGVCDDSDVIEAINHAVVNGHRIISMSFAGSESNILMEEAIDNAWNNGVLLIAAAGNVYTDDILYPAGYSNVISVGASDHLDNLSAFSNYGVAASILAPGSHIISTVPGNFCGQLPGVPSDCYDTKSGTSMAAPHVAGLAALMWSEYPTASNTDIRAAIDATADETGALGQNLLAWSEFGRINMQAALSVDPTGPGGTDPSVVLVQQPIAVSTINLGKGNKQGRASVIIVDDLGDSVPGAQVTGVFTGSFVTPPFIVTTDNNGEAVFQTTDSQKGGISFTFCVNAVVADLDFMPTNGDCSTF